MRGAWLLAMIWALPVGAQGPTIGGCEVFPADNIWNARIDHLPVAPESAAYVGSIGADKPLHADFGPLPGQGIPYNVVPAGQPKVAVRFQSSESDPGPYPIPAAPLIEGGSDRHLLVVEQGSCKLYELFAAQLSAAGGWRAVIGAIFDLKSHALRPAGWSSADAAGLPILAGLVRWEEVAGGEIRHALRFTAPRTRRAWVWPARHHASRLTDPALPPMGQRFRLRPGFGISGFSLEAQVILRALKRYGMMLADNGQPWFVQGAPDARWRMGWLAAELRRVRGADFQAVDVAPLMAEANSGRVKDPR